MNGKGASAPFHFAQYGMCFAYCSIRTTTSGAKNKLPSHNGLILKVRDMKVKVFPVNGSYTICAVLPNGSMDPHYPAITDIAHHGNAQYIADRINEAYRAGETNKAIEIRKVLGLLY